MPAINLRSTLRFGVFQSPLLRCGTLAVLTLAMTAQASAQRPLRRLGDRLRETIQSVQRVPASAPRVPAPLPPGRGAGPLRVPPSALPPTPDGRAALPPRSNYNAPQSSLRPAVAPTPRAAVPYGMQAPASQASAAAPLPSSVAADTNGQPASQARLGITVETPPSQVSPGSTARAARGAVIVNVDPGSSADSAGLEVGDRIVAVDGRLVEGVEDLVSLLGGLNEGARMDVMYVRNEKLSERTAVISDSRTGISVLNSDDEASELPAPAADNASAPPIDAGPADAPGMQNLGRMLGSWLGGGASNADADAPSVVPQPVPEIRSELDSDGDLPAPVAGPAGDAEVTGDTDDFEPLSSQETDPPSLDGGSLDSIEPTARSVQPSDDGMETLPPPATPTPGASDASAVPRQSRGSVIDPFAAGFAEDSLPAEAPATNRNQESLSVKRSTATEQDTVRLLLDEIEKLRQRVKQLESDRPVAAE
ncbi:MAG: PDZ domain-containing protein [Planctomycetaceae bacterium]